MTIEFWKMHGAGNDFLLVDDRQGRFPETDAEWIRSACARRTGVGAEGLILIQNSETADFRMRFFNPDGSEVEMCGNGARCVARLAFEIGAAQRKMRFDTMSGRIEAEVLEDGVRLGMGEPRNKRINMPLEVGATPLVCHFVNTGVPHAVVLVEDLAGCDVQALGSAIRYHQEFAPAGTNANFLQVTGSHAISVRTYERGVEAETLACGTGITAGALVAGWLGEVEPPVKVRTAGGYELEVDFNLKDGKIRPHLEGPAEHVFRGVLDYRGNEEEKE